MTLSNSSHSITTVWRVSGQVRDEHTGGCRPPDSLKRKVNHAGWSSSHRFSIPHLCHLVCPLPHTAHHGPPLHWSGTSRHHLQHSVSSHRYPRPERKLRWLQGARILALRNGHYSLPMSSCIQSTLWVSVIQSTSSNIGTTKAPYRPETLIERSKPQHKVCLSLPCHPMGATRWLSTWKDGERVILTLHFDSVSQWATVRMTIFTVNSGNPTVKRGPDGTFWLLPCTIDLCHLPR